MFKRKLQALNFSDIENFDPNDENKFRNFVIWLEDQKIRHLKIEDRAGLRDTSSEQWPTVFSGYLCELMCPHQQPDRPAVADWLLGYAVRLEYGDNVEKYKQVKAPSAAEGAAAGGGQAPSDNPFNHIQFDSAEFKAGVASLAALLNIAPHEDHRIVLQAVTTLIKNKLSKKALQDSKPVSAGQGEQQLLENIELGFDTGDYVSNSAAKILRLLHIQELRKLQTDINRAIVAVQEVTANPKTDARLGKVGR